MSADSTQFNAQVALPLWNKFVVTATGSPEGVRAATQVCGLYCITAGTVAVYDSSNVQAGTARFSGSLTAGQRLMFADGDGVLFMAGVYLVVTSGTYLLIAQGSN